DEGTTSGPAGADHGAVLDQQPGTGGGVGCAGGLAGHAGAGSSLDRRRRVGVGTLGGPGTKALRFPALPLGRGGSRAPGAETDRPLVPALGGLGLTLPAPGGIFL